MGSIRSQVGSVHHNIGWKRGRPRTKQFLHMPVSPAFIPDFSESRDMHDTRVEMLQLACKSDRPSKEVVNVYLHKIVIVICAGDCGPHGENISIPTM